MQSLTWMFNSATVIVPKHTRQIHFEHYCGGCTAGSLHLLSGLHTIDDQYTRPLSATLYPSAGPLSDRTTFIKHCGSDLMLS